MAAPTVATPSARATRSGAEPIWQREGAAGAGLLALAAWSPTVAPPSWPARCVRVRGGHRPLVRASRRRARWAGQPSTRGHTWGTNGRRRDAARTRRGASPRTRAAAATAPRSRRGGIERGARAARSGAPAAGGRALLAPRTRSPGKGERATHFEESCRRRQARSAPSSTTPSSLWQRSLRSLTKPTVTPQPCRRARVLLLKGPDSARGRA